MTQTLDSPTSYDYVLPKALIARHPAPTRTASQLMICDGARSIAPFAALADHLRAGDLLVFNDTRVVPCRLFARKPSGGRVELFALAPTLDGAGQFPALTRANKPLKPGVELSLVADAKVRLVERNDRGIWTVQWLGEGDLSNWLERHGEMPLPPYIQKQRRDSGEPEHTADDRVRYQTVYARKAGAVAAPTAGLHFTDELLSTIADRGVERAFVTLHVGMGTFKPLGDAPLSEQTLHEERYEVTAELLAALDACRARGGRVVAVGTTATRALEDMGQRGVTAPGTFPTSIFIKPGYRWHNVDAMVTNFHLPKSSLIVMVAAFIGYDEVMAAYREAVQERLRFYSYGDAMFLTRKSNAHDQ